MRISLYQSPVEFCENPHGYRLGDKRMSGITSLIHDVLSLGGYPDASDYVRKVAIPRAGEYGTSVHKAIETYDTLGLKVTLYPRTRWTKDDTEEFWDVSRELDDYIASREGFEAVANEYTVSDEIRYASNIDNIWREQRSGELWLVDTKTNNLNYYPGGAEALKEYLSWQLSIYAYLFERQNPGLKASRLACNWMHKGESDFWDIERKDDTLVCALLSVPWEYIDGHFVYDGSDVAHILNPATTQLVPAPERQIVPREVVRTIEWTIRRKEEMDEVYGQMKRGLREAMEQGGVKSWDSGSFKATIAADSTAETFDTARFRREHPELYKEYTKQTTRKGGFTIKLKDHAEDMD